MRIAPPASLAVAVAIPDGLPCTGVTTRQQLIDAVATCTTVTVASTAEIDLAQVGDNRTDAPDSVVTIPDGVTLLGGRTPTSPGALLFMSRRLQTQTSMLSIGANTRISGVRLRGYDQLSTKDRQDPTVAIRIRSASDGVTIDNNEIFGWPNAGVEVQDAPNTADTADRVRVTGNFIHHNVQCGAGYGVVVGGHGFALIDRNTFDFNRHDVAGDGSVGSGYVATLNLVLTNGPTCDGNYNQHFDMHGRASSGSGHHDGGGAGDFVEIRRNTIRGDQSYAFLGRLNRPAFELRGTPDRTAVFAENAVAHEDEDSAVRIKGATRSTLKRAGKLVVSGNRYGVDTASEVAVGDFDGDGRADVFQATGAVWVYSPGGTREWRYLNDSTLRLNRLAFGDFDGDKRTDVFAQSGDQWLVSYAGTGPWTALPAGSNIPMNTYYRFGDFDGDTKTDVFRANGSQFFISSGGASEWRPLATSRYTVGDLRFGDFDGDGRTDVFSLANGRWSVSDGGAGEWRTINARLSSNLSELVFADFDGDRRTDIARTSGGRWQMSSGGSTPWRTLRSGSESQSGLLFGDFDGDRRADALTHGLLRFVRTPPRGTTVTFFSLSRFLLSSGNTTAPLPWSQQDMR
jgi:hypothetical protein